MMPGENQSKAGEVASEATTGTCQNCTILNRSLDEYMSALLALKQKIIDTDHLLSEYKEKCDELQKSQRESSKLHKQLDEVLLKLGPLEEQAADYKTVKAELAEMKTTMKSYQQKSEEVDSLREEKVNVLTLKKQLEDSLRKAEDTVETQSQENAKLRSEKKSLEESLQETQDSLRTCQQAVDEVDGLRMENAKTLIQKSNLENQLLALEDTNLKQNNEIKDLKSDNSRLSEVLLKTQEKHQKLEKEFNKEKINISTQTERETKVDKAKVKVLLQQLWQCVDPLSETTVKFDLSDGPHLTSPPKHGFQRSPIQLPSGSLTGKQTPQSAGSSSAQRMNSQTPSPSTSRLNVSPGKSKLQTLFREQNSPRREQGNGKPGCEKKPSQGSEGPSESSMLVQTATESPSEGSGDGRTVRDSRGSGLDLWDVLNMFSPLPAPLSPMSTLSDEPAAIADDPSPSFPKESSPSRDKDNEKSSLLTMDVAVPSTVSDSALKTSSLGSENPVVPLCTDNVVHDNFLSECQDMEVEELCKTKEKPENCAIETVNLQNGCERDCIQTNPARIIATGSQPSTMEDCTNLPNQSQSDVDDEIPSTLCNGVSNKGSGLQPLNTDCKCLDTDDRQEKQSSFTPEEIQSSMTPEDTSIRTDSNIHDTTCIKVDGVSCLSISKDNDQPSAEKEVFCLEEVSLRPSPSNSLHHLNGDGTNNPESFVKQPSVSQTEAQSPKKEKAAKLITTTLNPESERNDGTLEDRNITDIICKPAIPEENVAIDGQQVNDAHNCLEEEQELPEALGFNVENMGGSLVTCLKNQPTKEHQIAVNSQEARPSCLIATAKPLMLPSLDKGATLSPLAASIDALSSTPSPDSLGRVRTEMGPPLPPVVMPLTATPPKFVKNHNPVRLIEQVPSLLSADGHVSPVQQATASSPNSSFEDEAKMSPCLTTPSPSSLGVPSFPLQFGSETPKHAVPVPGRLPSSALSSSSSPTVSQESSMQLLDTMYPELSAQARTLTILRGNVGLGRAASESRASPPSVSQISGNKTINSSSTAFTKTEQKVKRMGVNVMLPKSAKRLRLDACSPGPANIASPLQQLPDAPPVTHSAESCTPNRMQNSSQEPRAECSAEVKRIDKRLPISEAIEKIQSSCFDLLPVIKSHVFLGRISKVPVLRDEEKSVVADFSSDEHLADELMLAILSKMKMERAVAKPDHLHALCRVYVGLCRLRGDYERVHALAYHLLKEDFPEATKMILFTVTTWPTILSHQNPLCKAINALSKAKATGEVLNYLTVYLQWDETPTGDINKMITSTLKALLEDGNLKFQKHNRYGDDLCPSAWEYIFTVDLLCSHLGWKWTLENIIGKELWPVMNTWVTQPRHQQTPVRDVCVAAVLRLIGRLGQLGIKEKLCEFVQNVSKTMNLFAKHGIAEGVPWEVQLAAVYAIYDLAPVSPKEALDALASWRGETSQLVPPAVTSCITQIGSLCRQIKP